MLSFAAAWNGIGMTNTSGGGILRNKTGDMSGSITLVNFHTDIIGSEHDDTIIDTAAGDKTINGGAGNDVIEVDTGSGRIFGGAGDDTITGGALSDVIHGGDGSNTIDGGPGSDLIVSSGFDSIDGGNGHDWIKVTNSGSDVDGGAGNDVIEAASQSGDPFGSALGGEIMFGPGSGHDTLDGYLGQLSVQCTGGLWRRRPTNGRGRQRSAERRHWRGYCALQRFVRRLFFFVRRAGHALDH